MWLGWLTETISQSGLLTSQLVFLCTQHYISFHICQYPGPQFNIKMTSYQYRKSHCRDMMILRPSYLHNGISYTGKMTSLYWMGAQMIWLTISLPSIWRNMFHCPLLLLISMNPSIFHRVKSEQLHKHTQTLYPLSYMMPAMHNMNTQAR